MNIAFNTSVSAMLGAQTQLADAARQIANPRADSSGIIDAVVALKEAENTHAAAAAVIRTTAEMEATLIDITA